MTFRFTLFILAGLISMTVLGCKTEKSQHDGSFLQPPGRLRIVTTTGMIADAVKNVVGDSADVEALMGPGVDPHLYKATQGDLEKLNNADVIFYNGLHLEGKMVEVFEKLALRKPVIAVSKRIDQSLFHKVPGSADAYDPHIWFDVKLWQQTVMLISDTLRTYNLKSRNYFQSNATAYLKQLDSLHNWVYSEIATIPEKQRVLITAHDAFGYFGAAYHIEVRGLQGISTVSEFGLKDMTNLVNLITSRGIKAVFVESSVPRRSIEAVVAGCQERGHKVAIGGTLYSDAMGKAGTPDGTYIGMVSANVRTIVSALK